MGRSDIVASATLSAYGARVRINGDDEAVRAVLSVVGSTLRIVDGHEGAADATVTLTLPVSGSSGAVRSDGETVVESDDVAELLRRALSELHLAVAVHAGEGLFVHAGAVAWRGSGIVLPGRSMSGKTTLVRALVEAGAEYYSDEYAVLDPAGRLLPYAKPLSVRKSGSGSEMLAPTCVGAVGVRPVPVGLVVSTRYERSAVWQVERVCGAAAILPLVDNTVAARLAPARMLEATAAVAGGALCVRGPRPDAGSAAVEILALADQLADRRGRRCR